MTIDAPIFEKLFITDDSSFFAIGLLIYQQYRGRRDVQLCALSALALGTAVFQAIHRLERLGVHTGASFDPKVVAAICVVSLGIVLLATRVTRVQLPAKIVLAAGGITYPLYLLHMQLGYVIFTALGPQQHVLANTCAIVVGTFALAYGVWRFFEPSAHSSTRAMLTEFAGRAGLSVSPKTTERATGPA
jgi:peptidoglycan/LPS O-acetylase OafA/YrhL